jgi:hypothetical protein
MVAWLGPAIPRVAVILFTEALDALPLREHMRYHHPQLELPLDDFSNGLLARLCT